MILLAKYKEVDSPELFRNIALTDCDGKMYFSMISRDIETFMVENELIKTEVQKDFLIYMLAVLSIHLVSTNHYGMLTKTCGNSS